MSSWTQVYVKGLAESTDPTDGQLEEGFDARYELSHHPELAWAGPGSTIVKRTDQGVCRGYAFLCFFSTEGATKAVERIVAKNLQNLQKPAVQNHPGEEENLNEVKCDNDITPQPEQLPTDVLNEEPPSCLPLQLHAELCKPKPKSKKKKPSNTNSGGQDHRDLRIRRQRGAPVRKHPVITSSDGSRTCLGNKTK